MTAHSQTISATPPASPWIYGPWLDLIVGCGAWSAPLLGAALLLTQTRTHAWVVAFYLLALAFNYPHFMATVYRAYHTRADFEKYKIFTLHITLLLVLTGILLHASYQLFPWVFTLYILWSPWHYTGQNFGLLMMFARRSGTEVTPRERFSIRAAFVASYLMLLASFETGGSTDPLILSLGLSEKFTLPARLALAAAFALFIACGFWRPIKRHGGRTLVAPLTLALTQFIWFVVPTLLELHAQIPQTRYSSGILAVLHSAQYIWITSYYQRREARAAGQSGWRMTGYLLTLVAGGIALFIPGPWIVSRVLHYDFTTSFLIFTAVVNIHHFILDGALWKLRDSRIAGLLIGGGQKKDGEKSAPVAAPAAPSQAARLFSSPAFRIAMIALLFLWGGFDQLHFALGTHEDNLSSLLAASRMNPWDSTIESRIAATEAKAGDHNAAVDSLARAVNINPHDEGLQQAYARALLEAGRYPDAYDRYSKLAELFPRDPNVLVSYGLLSARLGHADDATDAWEKAVSADADQINAHLYLAEAFDQRGEFAAAARHWDAFLRLAAAHPDDPAANVDQQISGAIQLADDQSSARQPDAALVWYRWAASTAEAAGNTKLESLAYAHMADSRDKFGDVKSAAAAYEHGLALDAKTGDAHVAALDWFNYGQFLRRHGMPDDLVYACLLHSEQLLAPSGGAELETATKMRREVETKLGNKASASQKELPELLARAGELPTYSF
jgi:tetratricopeptide (TPR) repeat protein